jgi:hypothetical protein
LHCNRDRLRTLLPRFHTTKTQCGNRALRSQRSPASLVRVIIGRQRRLERNRGDDLSTLIGNRHFPAQAQRPTQAQTLRHQVSGGFDRLLSRSCEIVALLSVRVLQETRCVLYVGIIMIADTDSNSLRTAF